MIYTANPNKLKKHLDLVRNNDTEVLLITQFGFDFKDAKRYRKLAPSKNLFGRTKIYKEEYGEDWFKRYKEAFNKELNWDRREEDKLHIWEDKQEGLNYVKDLYNDGKDVILVCYCADEKECHRTLVAEKLEEMLNITINELE